MTDTFRLADDLQLTADRAAFIASASTLVIADVHVGYARAARRRGGWLPAAEGAESLAERVSAAGDAVSARTLIIAGDLRHSTRDVDDAERDEVARFVVRLRARFDAVTLVAGNHDRGDASLAREARAGDVRIVHAPPRAPSDDAWTVCGHLHPVVIVRDETGAGARYPCALVSERVVVLPAFTDWAGGASVERLRRHLPDGAWRVIAMTGRSLYEQPVNARSSRNGVRDTSDGAPRPPR